MPSHPDRVRRNYHDMQTTVVRRTLSQDVVVTVAISKDRIASAMSKRELRRGIDKLLDHAIENIICTTIA
jgi:hypothetical protein